MIKTQGKGSKDRWRRVRDRLNKILFLLIRLYYCTAFVDIYIFYAFKTKSNVLFKQMIARNR